MSAEHEYAVIGGRLHKKGIPCNLSEASGVKPGDRGQVKAAIHIHDGLPLRFNQGEVILENGRYFMVHRPSSSTARFDLYHERLGVTQ